MAKFLVKFIVHGDIYIDADSEASAHEIVENMPYDEVLINDNVENLEITYVGDDPDDKPFSINQ